MGKKNLLTREGAWLEEVYTLSDMDFGDGFYFEAKGDKLNIYNDIENEGHTDEPPIGSVDISSLKLRHNDLPSNKDFLRIMNEYIYDNTQYFRERKIEYIRKKGRGVIGYKDLMFSIRYESEVVTIKPMDTSFEPLTFSISTDLHETMELAYNVFSEYSILRANTNDIYEILDSMIHGRLYYEEFDLFGMTAILIGKGIFMAKLEDGYSTFYVPKYGENTIQKQIELNKHFVKFLSNIKLRHYYENHSDEVVKKYKEFINEQ